MPQAIEAPVRTNRGISAGTDFAGAKREALLECLVGFMRRNPTSAQVNEAVEGIVRILAAEFPSDRYECNISWSELGSRLLDGVREGRPVVLAFTHEDADDPAAWSWTIHFVEIAGVGARINDVVASIHTPRDGTWRAGDNLKSPLEIAPFGRASHQWSCLTGPWSGSRVTLTFFGSYGEKGQLITIHAQPQWPE